MKKASRWRPKFNEPYWVVDTDWLARRIPYWADKIDDRNAKTGNMFRTRAEAQAVVRQIRKIFKQSR